MTPVVSDTEDDELDNYLVDFQNYSGVCDEDIQGILECYLNLPEADVPEENPLNYSHIRERQQADEKLTYLQQKFPSQYIEKTLDDSVEPIICCVKPNDDPRHQWRIALPENMVQETVEWFH